MQHALITIISPLGLVRLHDAEAAIDELGNMARPDIRKALDMLDSDGEQGIHFASCHAIQSQDGLRAYIAFEFSADGSEEVALARLVKAIGKDLKPIFMLSSDWRDGSDFLTYLQAHRVNTGFGFGSNPGVGFSGTPGLSVGNILTNAKLAHHVEAILGRQSGHVTALARIQDVRNELHKSTEFSKALGPATAELPFEPDSIFALIVKLAVSFVATFLWPVVVLVIACAAYVGVARAMSHESSNEWIQHFLIGAWHGLIRALVMATIAVIIVILLIYTLFRKAEDADAVGESVSDHATLQEIFRRENHYAQNHMLSITQRKPGLIRLFTSRLIFWAISGLAQNLYRPGFLSDIGTIHFARWVTAPNSPDLFFFSNYDGSWESYLEDFITKAHNGLTGVWSNSIGFPRSENLVDKGATDGERFKRFARHSMIPTRFWYSAYPDLTTAVIRKNTVIRRGLSGVMTEDDAKKWLSLFGSAIVPNARFASNEIQSLLFGGLGFLPFGTCLISDLPSNQVAARKWLAEIQPLIAFGDGRRLQSPAVIILALGAGGLVKLGLPAKGIQTFPFAYVEGMANNSRARILGDVGQNAKENWRWGKTSPDAAVLIYGRSAHDVAQLMEKVKRISATCKMKPPHEIPMQRVIDGKTEPFGFADGISQPIIRGTYKSLGKSEPTNLVEAGEFILGYPDNRGNLPPGPSLPALDDPRGQLPVLDSDSNFGQSNIENQRDLGRNGSFLVIRELEQNVKAFKAYCKREAARISDNFPAPPYNVTPEFIGAKIVGRWQDGSPLARHPYDSATAESQKRKARDLLLSKNRTAQVKDIHGNLHESDNDFMFGVEDPQALRCPYGAHIRRANPRDSFDPGSEEQIAIVNRHRIIRVGREYVPRPKQNPGLLFMCLNGDIERQFEFVQQTWHLSASFHGLANEKDILLNDEEASTSGYTIPTRNGPVRLSPAPQFVSTKGGGYFFLPGKRLIDYLIGAP